MDNMLEKSVQNSVFELTYCIQELQMCKKHAIKLTYYLHMLVMVCHKYLLIYGTMPGSSVVIMDSTECLVLSRTDFTMGFSATPYI